MKKIILFTILFNLFCGLTHKKKEKKMSVTISQTDKIKVTSLYFPTDGGRWVSKIVDGFESEAVKSKLNLEFNRVGFTFNMTNDEVVERIIKTSPDFIYLPDDLLYKKFAKILNEKTGAYILFSTFYSEKASLNLAKEQSGVFADAPVKFLIEQSQKITKAPVKSISLIGGPFSDEIMKYIEKKIPKEINVSKFKTESWQEYESLCKKTYSKNHILFPLAPFGVKTAEKKPVEDFQFKNLMLSLDTTTLGYGGIKGYSRTISMAIAPEVLGQNTGRTLLKKVVEGNSSIDEYKSFDLSIENQNIKRLGYTVPNELIGFIVL